MFSVLKRLQWPIAVGLYFICSYVFGHGMSEADKAKALEATNWDFVELGASHMVTGYDHLLFLFGVIFFLTKFNDVVKFVTAFTIGHSITLLFATLYHIQANYYLIDAVIALTVIYKGFDNLGGFKKYFDVASPNLLLMVFIFGLIHGFGLSTRLQMLPLPEEGLVLKILSFNLGVELGQIAALSVMLAAMALWRKTKSFNTFSNAANAFLMCLGVCCCFNNCMAIPTFLIQMISVLAPIIISMNMKRWKKQQISLPGLTMIPSTKDEETFP